MDASEGQVAGRPDLCSVSVCREHGSSDVIGADEVERVVFDNAHGFAIESGTTRTSHTIDQILFFVELALKAMCYFGCPSSSLIPP